MQNGITILREERTRTVGQNPAEVPDVAVGVSLPVEDVDPFELTAVILRVEVHFVGAVNRAGNHGTEHILMVDVAQLEFGSLVRRVNVILGALRGGRLDERVNPDHLIGCQIGDTEPRRIRINRVVETTVRTLDAQRGQEFIGFCPTVVLADVRVQTDDRLAGFSRGDQHEHRSTILTAHGVRSRAVADELHVEPLEDALSQLTLRERGVGRGEGGSGAIPNTVDNRTVNDVGVSAVRAIGGDDNAGDTGVNQVSFSRNLRGVLITIPLLPDD